MGKDIAVVAGDLVVPASSRAEPLAHRGGGPIRRSRE